MHWGGAAECQSAWQGGTQPVPEHHHLQPVSHPGHRWPLSCHPLTWASVGHGPARCRRRQHWHTRSSGEPGGWAPGGTGDMKIIRGTRSWSHTTPTPVQMLTAQGHPELSHLLLSPG